MQMQLTRSLGKDASLARLGYNIPWKFKKMRVGEKLFFGSFDGPGYTKGTRGSCECYLRRDRGKFSFFAVWTIALGKKVRPILLTSGIMHWDKKDKLFFLNEKDFLAWRAFLLICRRVDFAARLLRRTGATVETQNMLWRNVTVGRNGRTRSGEKAPDGNLAEPLSRLIFPEA